MPSELLFTMPYLATIVVRVIISRNRQMLALHFPASLAKPYRPATCALSQLIFSRREPATLLAG